MGIEDLKRWHWIAIGLLLGLAFSYAWTGQEPEAGRNNVNDFLTAATVPVDPKIGPLVRNIVVQPAQPDFRTQATIASAARKEQLARDADEAWQKPPGDLNELQRVTFVQKKREEAKNARAEAAELRRTADQNRVNLVLYDRLVQRRDGSRTWAKYQFIAENPFCAAGAGRDGAKHHAIPGLDEDAISGDELSLRVVGNPAGQYAIWTSGSVIAIGILWPNVLNGLLGAGYGRKREPNAKESLFAYKSRGGAEPARPAKPRVTAADQQRLRDMTDQLERNLTGDAAHRGDAPLPAAGADAQPVRKLDGGPVEPVPVQAKPTDEEIEVKGEYYPVLIHHKKHHSEDEPAAPAKPAEEKPG